MESNEFWKLLPVTSFGGRNTKERISNIANKTNINLIRIVAPSFLSARQRVALFNKIGCARD